MARSQAMEQLAATADGITRLSLAPAQDDVTSLTDGAAVASENRISDGNENISVLDTRLAGDIVAADVVFGGGVPIVAITETC